MASPLPSRSVPTALTLAAAVLLLLAAGGCAAERTDAPRAVDGAVTLTRADLQRPVPLAGEWHARPGGIAAPDTGWRTVEVPRDFETQGFASRGQVTYRLRMRLPADVPSLAGYVRYTGNASALYASSGEGPREHLGSAGDLAVADAAAIDKAVKLGAFDYLAKPADADEIDAALRAEPGARAEPPENPMSADRVRWEHIQRVFEQCDRNVSETARRLKMHRRTLQRILNKHAPRP